MFKRLILTSALLTLIMLLLVACGERTSGTTSSTTPSPDTGTTTSDGGTTIQLQDESFSQSTLTIKKGESIKLVNASVEAHIIENGSWENNAPKPAQEEGAPQVSLVAAEKDNSGTIGPFNTAGTFHIYCTVHPGMNLVVTVQ